MPSDVTVESTAWESTASERNAIPADLLAVVGSTEKSFERELRQIRQSNFLPSKYTDEIRSNLYKELNDKKVPQETDNLLGTFSDDMSIRTDDQSHTSKITFGVVSFDAPYGSTSQSANVVETVNTEACRTANEVPQHDNTSAVGSEQSIPIEYSGCEHLMMEIHKNLKMHRLAADYFKFRNFLFFQCPQTVFAIASTVLAFMGAVDVFEGAMQTGIVATAGLFSALVVLLQTLSGYCIYGTRASMHDGTTTYLRDLDDDLTMIMSKLKKPEMTEKKEDESNEHSQQTIAEMNEDTFESLQSRYRHSLKGCKSDVPTEITEAFAEIDSFILLSRTSTNRKYLMECGMFGSQEFRGITLKAYDRLASNMVGYFYWPLKIPCPKKVVKMTIDETRSDLHQMRSFWETPPPKEESIFSFEKIRHTIF